MRYQLPDGTYVEMSIDEYLSMDDISFNDSISRARTCGNKTEESPLELNQENDEIKPNISIRQIIDNMASEQED